MIVGTTPTHTFNVPIDTSSIKVIRVIYKQGDKVVMVKTKDDCTFGDKKVMVKLTQEDTFKFDHKSPVKIQLRILTLDGTALASIPKSVGITECFEDVVME